MVILSIPTNEELNKQGELFVVKNREIFGAFMKLSMER